jgi:5-formyltetrahydrofolate cyclo-ligase
MPARWQDYAMENQKEGLRKKLQSLRPHSSAGLTDQLLALVEKLNPKRIASYQPQPAEPDISEFNQLASQRFELVFPRVIGSDLEFASGPFVAGGFGILEPTGPAKTEIDLVLVPALAADRMGNRLGKGRGFYDRFLTSYSGVCYAVVFEQELLDSVPVEDHDRAVDGVVTPTLTIDCY